MDEPAHGGPSVPWYFDDSDKLTPGTGYKKRIEPYVRVKFCELNHVPTPALIVWLMLLRQWAATKNEWVTIPKRIRQAAGASRKRISRGLMTLEEYDFVELRKEPGKATRARRR